MILLLLHPLNVYWSHPPTLCVCVLCPAARVCTGVVPHYEDTLGGDNNHMLLNNPGQNPVAYTACARGTAELGFRTYYVNTNSQKREQGLADGDIIGVIGDTTTKMNGDRGQGGKAPHGTQYYAMEETGGFAFVQIDSVDVSDYTNATMAVWVHIEAASWEDKDMIKVWVTDEETNAETVLLLATDIEGAVEVDSNNGWVEHAKRIAVNRTAVMSFGMQSDSHHEEAWFDYVRIYGHGPNRSQLLCSPGACGNGTLRAYTGGTAAGAEVCNRCPAGSVDSDFKPSTACTKCSAGRYVNATGAVTCTGCPGYPTRANSPLGATRKGQCQYVVGYTSFEEPKIIGGTTVPKYFDVLGGETDHQLLDNPGQSPVSYRACSHGSAELGFRTYYTNPNRQTQDGGLADGDAIGVIGDTTTSMQGNLGQGAKAPHGSQYYMLEDTGGFAYVQMDPVSIADYINVSMAAWVHVESTDWETTNMIKVWATEGSTGEEIVLLEGTDLDFHRYVKSGTVTEDQWVEYTAMLDWVDGTTSKSTAVMAFGLKSDETEEKAWFDFLRIVGNGPDRSASQCAQLCLNGTQRDYVTGANSSTAVCSTCPAGYTDDDSNPLTECVECQAGQYSSSPGSTQCTPCPGYPTRGGGYPGATSVDSCKFVVGYTSFEEVTILNISSEKKWVPLFEGIGGSSQHKNTWEGWYSSSKAYQSTGANGGKREAYDKLDIASLKLWDGRGYYVEYVLNKEYRGKTLLSIVRGCMGSNRRQSYYDSKWRNGHCTIGKRKEVRGLSGTDTVLRIGVGDSARGSSDTYDWALFAPLGGNLKNGGGDFAGRRVWDVGGEFVTNNGYTGAVKIYGTSGTGEMPVYRDKRGGDSSHWLVDNANENPVSYISCAGGSGELGFRSYYTNTKKQSRLGGLADGDVFGVIGDITTTLRGDRGQGGKAPHGSQYFAMEDTGGFAFVQMDVVDVSDYTNVSMVGWVHIEATDWEGADKVRVWATDNTTRAEVAILEGTDVDNSRLVRTGTVYEDRWVEYKGALDGFNTTVFMSFGLQADSNDEEVWFGKHNSPMQVYAI